VLYISYLFSWESRLYLSQQNQKKSR
jgi:hypothetical protein